MGIKSDIEDAVQVHGAWKAKFRDFLNGKAGMDLSEISHTHACKLGKWLEDGGQRMLSPENHAKTCELHAQFHRVAGDIVQNIKQKNFEAARQALASDGTFDQTSHALCAFLRKVALHGGPRPPQIQNEEKASAEVPASDAAAPSKQATEPTQQQD